MKTKIATDDKGVTQLKVEDVDCDYREGTLLRLNPEKDGGFIEKAKVWVQEKILHNTFSDFMIKTFVTTIGTTVTAKVVSLVINNLL